MASERNDYARVSEANSDMVEAASSCSHTFRDGCVHPMNPETQNWLASSEYDLQTAEHMLAAGRYIYVIFMCHLAIEKALKAIVCEVTNSAPPRTHNLAILMDSVGVHLEPRLDSFVRRLSNVSVATRYPEDMSKLSGQFTETVAKRES